MSKTMFYASTCNIPRQILICSAKEQSDRIMYLLQQALGAVLLRYLARFKHIGVPKKKQREGNRPLINRCLKIALPSLGPNLSPLYNRLLKSACHTPSRCSLVTLQDDQTTKPGNKNWTMDLNVEQSACRDRCSYQPIVSLIHRQELAETVCTSQLTKI